MSKYIELYLLPLPPTPELATMHGEGRYWSSEYCDGCSNKNPIRYVEGNKCYGCLRVQYRDTHHALLNNSEHYMDRKDTPLLASDAVSMNKSHYFTGDPCIHDAHPQKKNIVTGKCEDCRAKKSPRQIAIAAGERTYQPSKACDVCAKFAPKRVDNGACTNCRPLPVANKSARQIAKAAGESHYLPEVACPECKAIAPKSINNGTCTNCMALRGSAPRSRAKGINAHEPSAQLMKECPDIVMPRDEAKALGFKVFRTGLYCKQGHTDFQYVSTGGCVTCKAAR